MTTLRAVVLDVDGTLLDSVYHHTVAWTRALADTPLQVPAWRVHRAIGMGGDKLVEHVAGARAEQEWGPELRERWEQEYDRLLEEPRLLEGARELLVHLRASGLLVGLASSGIPRHAARAMELLDADELADAVLTSEDAEGSKPDPDLVTQALEELGTGAAAMVGDAVWDVRAGTAAGIPTLAVCSGGYGRDELLGAGAVQVFESLPHLSAGLTSAVSACEHWLEGSRRPTSADPRPRRSPGSEL
ncbi:HAD family hydrolase [Nocardioides nanhaiensis]|uniref:HAD family hydrolase n=1 Tax=Nocardioides nanhaiensis TaxID=1476871 RepID=A0ABP8VUB7_9ACTN